MALMFLSGGGMRGGKLHHRIEGAPFVGPARTAPRYRMYSVADQFPAVEYVGDGGVSVQGELYDLPLEMLRTQLMPAEPAELELGLIELADGASSLATVLRGNWSGAEGLTDISHVASWRAHLGLDS
ncbi:gamma-glutamylcyclotransferase [Allosaccharopolyspora coralli]|uniref:Gamma-glutamylcyclotransferase n=1 Tax=Allosaccharopolyspora coralli TaxID=2665642 RepID=A0A5Q3Q723_9PSEU|nr:gamma-glutamylcyclotransferase [Allosaccharopolyspora coralli]